MAATATPNLGLPQWTADETLKDHIMNDFNAAFLAIDANLLSNRGWAQTNEAWAYASASTITVAAGAATRWQKNDKIWFTQHGDIKKGYIIAVADTLLTVLLGTVVIENTATYPITDISFSRIENPFGFPSFFTWAPTVTAATGTPTSASATFNFSIKGGLLVFHGTFTCANKGTAAGAVQISLPVISATASCGVLQETATTGLQGFANINAVEAKMSLFLYNYTTLWVNGYAATFSGSCFY